MTFSLDSDSPRWPSVGQPDQPLMCLVARHRDGRHGALRRTSHRLAQGAAAMGAGGAGPGHCPDGESPT